MHGQKKKPSKRVRVILQTACEAQELKLFCWMKIWLRWILWLE